MRSRPRLLALPILLTGGFVSSVLSAPAEPYRATKVRHGGYTNRPEYTAGVSGKEFIGIRTRLDMIREMDELTKRASDRWEGALPQTPIRRLMERRNLLSARSPLGRKLTSDLGYRTLYTPDMLNSLGTNFDEVLKIPASMPATTSNPSAPEKNDNYESMLENRIKSLGDEYYQKGLDIAASYDPYNKSTRSRLLQARGYFNLARDADPQNPRSYFANCIICFHNNEPQQAFYYLTQGLRRTKTIDDLNIDKASFFKDQDKFRLMYDKADVFARSLSGSDQAAGNLMVAFFAHVYGDESLASTAIESAARNPPASLVDVITTFRNVLAGSKSPTSAPTSAPGTEK